MTAIVNLLKGLIPILEPLGEQGINQLFDALDKDVAKMGDGNDLKALLVVMLPGLRAFAIAELKKIQ